MFQYIIYMFRNIQVMWYIMCVMYNKNPLGQKKQKKEDIYRYNNITQNDIYIE